MIMRENEEGLVKHMNSKYKLVANQQKKCLYCNIKKNNKFSSFGEAKLLKSIMPERCKCVKVNDRKITDYKTNTASMISQNNSINVQLGTQISNTLSTNDRLNKKINKDQLFNEDTSLNFSNIDSEKKSNLLRKKSVTKLSKSERAKFFDALYKQRTNYIYHNNYTRKNVNKLLANNSFKQKSHICFQRSSIPTKSRLNQIVSLYSNSEKEKSKKIRFALNNSNEKCDVIVQTEQNNLTDFIKNYVIVDYNKNSNKNITSGKLLNAISDFELEEKDNNISYLADDSTNKQASLISVNDSSCLTSLSVSPIAMEKFANLNDLNVNVNDEVEFIYFTDNIINPNICGLPYFRSEIVSNQVNYEIVNASNVPDNLDKCKSFTLTEQLTKINQLAHVNNNVKDENSYFQNKSSNDIGIICYLCGKLYSSYSIHIHYFSCRKKWKRVARGFSEDITFPELPNPKAQDLQKRIFENTLLNSNKIYSLKDAYNSIMYESSKLNRLNLQKLICESASYKNTI